MRVYGLTLPELFLEDLLTWLGWILVVFGVACRIFAGTFRIDNFSGGLVFVLTLVTGLVMVVAASGIRQNRPALDLGFALWALLALAWLVHGIVTGSLAGVIAGILLVPLFLLLVYLRNLGIQARFKPRFFTLRQFETVTAIADTMIDGDGEETLHPIQVAINVDHFLSKFDSTTLEDIKQTLGVVEWLLPLLTLGRPFPFSSLGSHERRRAVEKTIGAKFPLFKDVARFLKLLANAGYYGSEEGMRQVGYRPFEERERSQGVDQSPAAYPDPFLR
jgi:hypothetical protein